MIVGTGIDIVEIERIRRAVESEAFLRRVYSEAEIGYCRGRGAQAAASFAARFAAKEAALKAFGTGLGGAGKLTEIETLPDARGCPRLRLYGAFAARAERLGVRRMHVSLSHARLYATAQIIFEGGTADEIGNGR